MQSPFFSSLCVFHDCTLEKFINSAMVSISLNVANSSSIIQLQGFVSFLISFLM